MKYRNCVKNWYRGNNNKNGFIFFTRKIWFRINYGLENRSSKISKFLVKAKLGKMKLLNIAIEAAIEAGKQIMKIYDSNNFEVSYKEDNSPLTKADIISHKTILNFLQSTNIPILSEEGKSIDYDLRKSGKNYGLLIPLMVQKSLSKEMESSSNIA